MAVIVDPAALAAYLQRDVSARTAAVVNEVVSGWLMTATGSTLPAPLPADLFAWALELAAVSFQLTETGGSALSPLVVSTLIARREAILAAVRGRYSSTSGPLYSFPEWDWSWTSVPSSALTD